MQKERDVIIPPLHHIQVRCPWCSEDSALSLADVRAEGLRTGCDTCGDWSVTLHLECPSCYRRLFEKREMN